MDNLKQTERIADKLFHAAEAYRPFLVEERTELEASVFEPELPLYEPPKCGSFRRIVPGETWGRDFGYGWFRAQVRIPERFFGRAVWLERKTGGVEGLLFCDGKPIGMFDDVPQAADAVFRLHRFVRLVERADGQSFRIDLEEYASHEFCGTMPYEGKKTFSLTALVPERVFEGLWLVIQREEVAELLHQVRTLKGLFGAAEGNEVLRGELLKICERAYAILPAMPSDGYDGEGVRAANAILSREIAGISLRGDSRYCRVGLIGHSHLDTAWLWPVEETKHKLARTVTNAVRLLNEYPEYKFLLSSAVYLKWLAECYPSLYSQVKPMIRLGRLEVNGATYVECDCNLPSGESLVRQFLRGQSLFQACTGRLSDCFWLPDTFGYSASLPQIMQGCGVRYFYTTKLSWNELNRFPYESFLWEGIDGTRVTAHFNTTQVYPDAACIRDSGDRLQNRHLSARALAAYGYGDGGGGPDRGMVRTALETSRLFGEEKVCHTTVSGFMRELEQDPLPVYSGELYLELHRGTYTSQHGIKRAHRELEIAFRSAEMLAALTGKGRQCKPELNEILDVLLLHEFHDILPGTCIECVNREAVSAMDEAAKRCRDLIAGVTPGGESYLFNPLSFDYEGYAEIPDRTCACTNLKGEACSVVRVRIPAFGSIPLSNCVGSREEIPFVLQDDELLTPIYRVRFNERMEIISLTDRKTGLEFVGSNGSCNALELYEDVPRLWDCWDIDADYPLKKLDSIELISREMAECTTDIIRIRSAFRLSDRSELVQDMVFFADDRQILFENRLDWHDRHRLLKVGFNTAMRANFCRSEIQFGYAERSLLCNTPQEQAAFETCRHKYADISEPGAGIALLSRFKYGMSAAGARMSLSLMKSGTHPDPSAEEGVHTFEYALLPHVGGFSFDSVIAPAYRFAYQPLRVSAPVNAFFHLSPGSVLIETIKPAEQGDDLILRLYESEGSHACAILRFDCEVTVVETDLLESPLSAPQIVRQLELNFEPFKLRTFKLRPC